MRILSVSDAELDFIYSPLISLRFRDVDMLVNCGDLPYYYFEYMISMLDVPAYYVHGNHDKRVEYTSGGMKTEPSGAVDLHRRCVHTNSGYLMAGIEGCIRYNNGLYQYSQAQMWAFIWGLLPRFFFNRIRYGRYLDIFVCHAPPWRIHDDDDLPHHGVKAFRWMIKVFKPRLLIHGHSHNYNPMNPMESQIGKTRVVNAYRFREITLE